MLQDIFIGKVKKDFIKAIKRLNEEHSSESIQIRLKFGYVEEKPILYAICHEWNLIKESTYKEIMDVKLDLMGQEGMMTPPLYEAMKKFCIELCDRDIPNFSAFLFLHGGDVAVAIYNGSNCVKMSRIEDLFA
jgi:hypothetical protein